LIIREKANIQMNRAIKIKIIDFNFFKIKSFIQAIKNKLKNKTQLYRQEEKKIKLRVNKL
jgi:hypothetical protein